VTGASERTVLLCALVTGKSHGSRSPRWLDGILIGAGDLRYMAWAMVGDALVAFMFARLGGLGLRFLSGRWAVTGAVRA
jgi:hypothetical protein